MYYRNKNKLQRNLRGVCATLGQLEDNFLIEKFQEEYSKTLSTQQAEQGVRTEAQCALRSDILTTDLNQSLQKLNIKKKITNNNVARRLLIEIDS